MTVELFSKEDCRLCDEARQSLKKLKKEFFFEIKEEKIDEHHAKFKEYVLAVPVVKIGSKEFSGNILEDELRAFLRDLNPPTKIFYIGKSLEALGFLTVGVGLMYGVMGNMWIDLYFFLGGIVSFAIGRSLEKKSVKK